MNGSSRCDAEMYVVETYHFGPQISHNHLWNTQTQVWYKLIILLKSTEGNVLHDTCKIIRIDFNKRVLKTGVAV